MNACQKLEVGVAGLVSTLIVVVMHDCIHLSKLKEL